MLLAAHNLIEFKSIDESSPRLAQPSTSLQWEKRGRALFRNKNYTQAVLCFERARRPDLLAPARAYELQASALQLPSGSRDAYFKRAEALELAELAFRSCSSAHDDVYSRRAGECRDERQLNLDAAYAISSLRSQGKQVSAKSSHVVEKLQ
jgi:tetratricopeptide (TPR) repeat protein